MSDFLLDERTPDLKAFDIIIVNSSGGKDSQCAIEAVHRAQAKQFSFRRIIVSHQDLGDMEWPGSLELAKRQALMYPHRFEVSKYRDKDQKYLTLLERIERRGRWPDNQNRYCTSEFKRGPGSRVVTKISKELRAKGVERPRILHVFGFRAQESPARRKKEVLTLNTRLTRGTQEVWDWLPIHHWEEDRVWHTIKNDKLPYHPAYDLGMPRLSCVFCIFAPKEALIIAGRNMPGLLEEYVALEKRIQHDFRHRMPLREVLRAVQDGENPNCTDGNWNM
jgi:3'-phosphoadenosine 5'-phosphosulfate sulfotransferase (PAPS reductase)/FAD synthetase